MPFSEEEIAEAVSAPLAETTFEEARSFFRAQLGEAVESDRMSAAVAIDLLDVFSRHFAALIGIARQSSFSSDAAIAANSAFALAMAAFTCGSRNLTHFEQLKTRDGRQRAAHARTQRATKSASAEINAAIDALIKQQKRPQENLSASRDRKAISTRIRPSLDKAINDLRREGFSDATPLSIGAIAKRIERMAKTSN